MNLIRRAVIAFAFAAGLAPAFAQAPPAVPALPDSERRTSYSLSSSTCSCSVGFALYGDAADYWNWVQVFLNGVQVASTDPTFGWTITSPSGSVATIARPITDAVFSFNSGQTGTVQIVGARRPRRTTTFAENRGVAARDLNQALNDIIAENRERWDQIGRAVQANPGETMAPLPPASSRANQSAIFDATGNLTSGSSVSGGATVSTAMQPVVSAATLPIARQLLGVFGDSGIGHGDANITIGNTERFAYTTAALTAARTWTLPRANVTGAPYTVLIADMAGGVTNVNTITPAAAAASGDVINNGTPPALAIASGGLSCNSDGVSRWVCLQMGAGTGVLSITAGNGLTGGTITTSGTIAADPSIFRSYLAGCNMSTAGSSITFTVQPCVATDSGNADFMKLASSINKTTSAWAVGTGNGCLDTGSITTNTWYHIFEIKRTDTAVVDVLCSLSASSPTMPASYTEKRRLGSLLTNPSANWTLFHQLGDEFLWDLPVNDVNATNPGTAAVLRTLTVPTGVQVTAINEALYNDLTPNLGQLLITSPDQADTAPSSTIFTLFGRGTNMSGSSGRVYTRTNTSGQVRTRLDHSNANTTIGIVTQGWTDRRGRDN